MKKKILIVTERRADYSKFRPILKKITKSSKLDYCLVVTGSHLLSSHGKTINEIKNDGFKISYKFSMYPKYFTGTNSEMVESFGRAILKITEIVKIEKPNLILAGFDIGANFAAAIVGSHMNIHVAHIEGGDITGTIDESIRHATSKFSHIHFTSNKIASTRLQKMGENKKFIFTVGSTGLDNILRTQKLTIENLSQEFKIDFSSPFIVVLQHTVTTEVNNVDKNFLKTLKAISELKIQALLIHGNADAGSQKLSKLIQNSSIQHIKTIQNNKYVNLLFHASALVGNSSSGIIETPFLKIPSVNIGTRQQGRLKSFSVIDVNYNKNEIKKAIKKAVFDKNFKNKVKKSTSLYGDGNSASKIVKILETLDLSKIPIQKTLSY
ncbi:UDP-N-acetylglucosamine 2-epimerase [Nitrosopumilus sp.]|uniref:UDP-N-acetylglucosamine 2-epimerase n=1 Tax=Nitrosopumilus sp. TaxID=2024843 RepID=UPI00247E1489|nr:UDP-N-acetylglucosamine 2-epimerase [Nitrosopumilus sp.]MCV0430389.1 UDP-N-acetylglucosamine 2-epimerase (hydrolyzing) [Nitrosopumilus sp.]